MDVAIFPFFFISIQVIFVFLVKQQSNSKTEILNYRVKKQIVKTCKIGYNWIFTTKFFWKQMKRGKGAQK